MQLPTTKLPVCSEIICSSLTEYIAINERLKFSLIIGDYWKVPEGSKFSGEKIISTGELLNFYQNINSTGGVSIPLQRIIMFRVLEDQDQDQNLFSFKIRMDSDFLLCIQIRDSVKSNSALNPEGINIQYGFSSPRSERFLLKDQRGLATRSKIREDCCSRIRDDQLLKGQGELFSKIREDSAQKLGKI